MTRQQDREEWARLNTCRFCIGSHLHTCTGYRCEPAIKQAEEYFDKVVRMKMKQATDLTPFFTEQLKGNENIEKAWILTDGDEEKNLVIKFGDETPKIARGIMLMAISKNLLIMADDEDKKAGGESSFGDLMNGIKIREWNPADERFIKESEPHEISKAEQEETK